MSTAVTNMHDEMEEKDIALPANKNVVNGKSCLKPKMADVLAYFKEYCNASGLHGVRYLSEERRNVFEKIFWFLVVTLCAVGCGFMIAKAKTKLDTSPVIVSFAESETSISHLPFPAVTICPYSKSSAILFNFRKFIKSHGIDGEVFEVEYNAWLKIIFNKMEKVYQDCNTKKVEVGCLPSNTSTWIKDKLYTDVYPYIYGNVICENLTILLNDMFLTITNPVANLTLKDRNATWFSQGEACLEDDNFCKSIRSYYPTWIIEVKQKVAALYQICWIQNDNVENVIKQLDSFDETAVEFLNKVSPKIDFHLVWNNIPIPSNTSLKPTWTGHGRCYTFNALDDHEIFKSKKPSGDEKSSDWHPDSGYDAEAGRNVYPRRSTKLGLDIFLEEYETDIDYVCFKGLTGYAVFLHQPQDVPQTARFIMAVPLNKLATITVKPSVLTTSPELKMYDTHKRQCYFSDENNLEYFKFYSKENCLVECEAKALLKKCGCVPFYFPRNASTKICGPLPHQCPSDTKMELEAHEEDKHKKELREEEEPKTDCDCLPSCFSIKYDADGTLLERDFAKFQELYYYESAATNISEKKIKYTIITVQYQDDYYIASRRSELYGKMDFLANCGGLLGLFCGFSLTSLIEVVYFLTIRLWSNLYRRWATTRRIHQTTNKA